MLFSLSLDIKHKINFVVVVVCFSHKCFVLKKIKNDEISYFIYNNNTNNNNNNNIQKKNGNNYENKTNKKSKQANVCIHKNVFFSIYIHTQISIFTVCVSLYHFISPFPPTLIRKDFKFKKTQKNTTYFSQSTAVVTIIIIVCKIAGCQSLNVLGPNTSRIIECLGDGQLVSR